MKQKWLTKGTIAVLLMAFLTGCSEQASPSNSAAISSSSTTPSQEISSAESIAPDVNSESETVTPEFKAKKRLSQMTLEQKVGQLFFLCYRKDADGNNLLKLDEASQKQIQHIQPGGITLFEENISTVEGVRSYIQTAESQEMLPPFISIDQEGGFIQRIKNTDSIPATNVPPMMEVGNTGDTALARKIGNVLGSELSVFGFNLDFAPDCDVFSNPHNTVIGNRSFSSDPNVAASMSIAVSNGLRDTGMIPVIKHFPGHGDTDADTHVGYAVSNKTKAELEQTELVPFREQIRSGAEMIMVAHISLPQINGDNTPATLSQSVVTGILRDELGFHGVAVTDAMDMGAITENYTSAQAATMALNAGMDMILMPKNPEEAYQAILKAVQNGTISQERLDTSVLRILTLKYKYDLFDHKKLSDLSVLGCEEHQKIVQQVTGG